MIATGIDPQGNVREEQLDDPAQAFAWAQTWIDGVMLHVPEAFEDPLEARLYLGTSEERKGVSLAVDDNLSSRYAAWEPLSTEWTPRVPVAFPGARELWPEQLFHDPAMLAPIVVQCATLLTRVWRGAHEQEERMLRNALTKEHQRERRIDDLPGRSGRGDIYWVSSAEFPRRSLPTGAPADQVRAEYDFRGAKRGEFVQVYDEARTEREDAWVVEVRRRSDDIRTDRVRTVSSEEVMARIRKRLRKKD